MKAEGSAPPIPIHKVKVKEETKECNYHHPSSPTTEIQAPTTMTVPVVGATANTITTTSTTNTNTANLSNHPPSTGSNSSTNEPTSPTSTHQNSSVICQVPSSTSLAHNGVEPVDLDIKSRGKWQLNSFSIESNILLKKNQINWKCWIKGFRNYDKSDTILENIFLIGYLLFEIAREILHWLGKSLMR